MHFWLHELNKKKTDLLNRAVAANCFMMTSSNGNIIRVSSLCAGNSPVPGEFSAQRPVTRSFDIFCDLSLNKRLSKKSRGWWFETPSWPLWRQCNVLCSGDSVRASIYEADGRLAAITCEGSKPRETSLGFSNHSEIWQARFDRCLSNFGTIRSF